MRPKSKTKWIIRLSGEINFLKKIGNLVEKDMVIAKVKNKIVESFNFSGFFGKMSQVKLDELNQKFRNTWVNNGDLICLVGGVFPKKICFPMSGNFLEIDEFGNLKIEKIDDNEKEVRAPVKSKVLKIEDDKLILEFEAREFKGESVIDGKSWGKSNFREINDIRDLNAMSNGEILFTNNLSRIFLLKAEVVGVSAVVTTVNSSDDLGVDLPVLKVDENDWKDLMSFQNQTGDILVNSKLGRLLVVIE